MYDEGHLYLRLVCHEPFMAEVRNPSHARDSAVWYDDYIGFFVDPGRTYAQMFEFALGAEGGIADCLNVWELSCMQYDPPRTDKVTKHADRWVAEMAIPWEALNVQAPHPGDVWIFNLVRTRPKSEHRPGEAFVLGPARERYAAHEYAAMLIFQ